MELLYELLLLRLLTKKKVSKTENMQFNHPRGKLVWGCSLRFLTICFPALEPEVAAEAEAVAEAVAKLQVTNFHFY